MVKWLEIKKWFLALFFVLKCKPFVNLIKSFTKRLWIFNMIISSSDKLLITCTRRHRMIFGRSSNTGENGLFSRVCKVLRLGCGAVLFYIISCFCIYYDEKIGYRAKGCRIQIRIILF